METYYFAPNQKYKVNRLGCEGDGSAVKVLIIHTDPGTSPPSVNPDPRDPALSSVFLRYQCTCAHSDRNICRHIIKNKIKITLK